MRYIDLKQQPHSKSKFGGGFVVLFLAILVVSLIVGGYFLITSKNGGFEPISVVANAAAVPSVKETDGRTNILLLGLDRRTSGEVHSILTDTIIVASVGKVDGDLVMVSIPRDLWVQNTGGYSSKINAFYATGGVESTKTAVESVLGIPVHYYVVIDFDVFRKAIDTLGGVDVNVDTAFDDYEYPVQGREADTCGRSDKDIEKMIDDPPVVVFPCRYEYLSFAAGVQKMDGATALKYVRSRHGTNGENTDFARSRRQQKLIVAVKQKALSLETLINPSRIKELFATFSQNIETDIDFSVVQAMYSLVTKYNFDSVRSVVFDDRSESDTGGLLYAPIDRTLYGGAYVLIPKSGDFSQTHAYMQKYLFGDK